MRGGDRYFRADGVRLRYRDQGEGPGVVLVHAWTLDLEVWDAQAAELSRTLRVVRLDRRGFGLSEGRPDPEAEPADLAALLDHLRLPAAAFVGMSQGARAVIGLALQAPQRVAGLVLDGLPGDVAGIAAGNGDYSLDEFRRLARNGGLEAFREAWRRHPLARLHGDDREAARRLERMLSRYPGRELLGPAPPAPAAPDPDGLARLSMPVLVINGELDLESRRLAGERLCALLPHAQRVLLAGAGHLAALDRPAAYTATLQSFLQRLSRAAA
ncbi:MAG TPA: alpha/beta hydrolase [Steroidobacteraceae bacterium]|nr:alpha/beta hydrolase [Steroidobacteraceae bacterium]